MAFQTASLLAVSLLILWVTPGKTEGKLGRGRWGGVLVAAGAGCLELRLLATGCEGPCESGLHVSVNLAAPVPASGSVPEPPNSSVCLSLGVSGAYDSSLCRLYCLLPQFPRQERTVYTCLRWGEWETLGQG